MPLTPNRRLPHPAANASADVSTDLRLLAEALDTGAEVILTPFNQRPTGVQPDVPQGALLFDTQGVTLYINRGAPGAALNWVAVGVSPGTIIVKSNDAGVPPGYVPADGTMRDPAVFAGLFAEIQTTWGGDGVTTFRLPNVTIANTAPTRTVAGVSVPPTECLTLVKT